MTLLPTPTEMVARARSDLRVGLPVILRAGDHGLVILAAETVTQARLTALRGLTGAVHLAVTDWRARTLKAALYDGDLARISLPGDVDVTWVLAVADPARDLSAPMKGPLVSLREGGADLQRIALSLAKSAHLLPCVVAAETDRPAALAGEIGATLLQAEATRADLDRAHDLSRVAAARLPMEAAEAGRLHVFRPGNGEVEHYAIEIGRPDRAAPVLTRLHSACFTGDVLGSLKCDCGPQLRGALAAMGETGTGILLYLNQEGRGIGLANKTRAYALQDQGFDTVEANHRLGFEDDERDFRIGAALLRQMGVSAIRLMTNNPRKVAMMTAEGIEVAERVPLRIDATRHNAAYLGVKRAKSGHLL